tara:strand:+ start:161 stop:529 length:369 start_codon:yes stop_codon:yes gene_type:complete
MADLKIPNLGMKSDKYIFKKNHSLKRKSKKRLFIESTFMFFLSLFLVYINYLIPNKKLLIQNLPNALNKSIILIVNLFSKISEIFLVFFIIISYLAILILLIGSLYRIFKIIKRKKKLNTYK